MTFNSAFLEQLREVRSAPPPSTAPARPAHSVSSCDAAPVADVVAKSGQPRAQPHPAVKVVHTVDAPQPQPLSLTGLPPALADLVLSAERGEPPSGAVKLSSGLVTDLTGYVLAWAACWPRDRAHVLWRLEEAYAVTVKP